MIFRSYRDDRFGGAYQCLSCVAFFGPREFCARNSLRIEALPASGVVLFGHCASHAPRPEEGRSVRSCMDRFALPSLSGKRLQTPGYSAPVFKGGEAARGVDGVEARHLDGQYTGASLGAR